MIPDLIHRRSPIPTATGFCVAIFALIILSRSESKSPANSNSSVPKSYITAIGIDLSLDGIVIAIGFASGAKQGKLLTLALTLELASLGLALIGELLNRKLSRLRGSCSYNIVSGDLASCAV